MNTRLDVSRKAAIGSVQLGEDFEKVFDRVLIRFLKSSAEAGFELEQLTVTVFDEVFTEATPEDLFDGTLGSFLSILMDEVHLRKKLGKSMLDVIMPASVVGYDIYGLIAELEATSSDRSPRKAFRRKVPMKALPVLKGSTLPAIAS